MFGQLNVKQAPHTIKQVKKVIEPIHLHTII